MSHRNPQSLDDAVTTLLKLYGNRLDPEKRAVLEIYKTMSRADLTNSPLNRGWFRGQIQYIIEYGLATKVYFPGTKTIEYLLLSSRGKAAFSARLTALAKPTVPRQQPDDDLTIDSIIRRIYLYQERNPQQVVDYSISVRKKETKTAATKP